MSQPGKSNFVDAEDLIPVIKFFSKNWILIPIFCSISFIIAYFYSHRLPDIYGAKAEILLKSNQTYDYQNKIYSNLGYYSVIQDLTNQKRVITSKDLIGKVIDKLNFNISYFIVGRIRTAQVDGFGALDIVCDWKKIHPRLYNVPMFIKVIDEKNFQLSYEIENVKRFQEMEFGKEYVQPRFTLQVNLANGISSEEMETIKEQTFKFIVHPREYLINKYAGGVAISNSSYSSILTLAINDGLPSHAQMFLDTLTQEYIHHTIENQIEINENTLKFIDKQIGELTVIIDSLEGSLNSFTEANEILDLSAEQSLAFGRLTAVEGKLSENDIKLKSLESLLNFFQDAKSLDLIPPINPTSFDDSYLAQQISKLFELKQRRANLLVDVKTTDARIGRLDSETRSIISNINTYIIDTKKTLLTANLALQDQYNKAEEKLKGIPKSKRDMLGIERKLTVNENLYNFLLEKRANTIIARAGIVPETTVVEKSRSMGVVGPDRKKYTYISLGVGFILSILVGLIRAMFFERIENTKELKAITKLPIIGGVPFYEDAEDKPISIANSPRSNISESFRSIRTNLQYLLPGDEKRRILVSSLHPGEGKTFVSVNLAAALAKAGKRVIILDFDMHKPKIHKVFRLSNTSGTSSFLVGSMDWHDSVIPSGIVNLDVLLAGPVPPNASELVLSKRVDELFRQVEAEYDIIIVDTPPLALISDSLVLLNKVNIGIFVMNTLKATKQGVKFLEETLHQNDISHISLLLNNIKQNRWRYYYSKYAYKYGYGYVYGYGYGYGDGYRYGYGEYSSENESADLKRKRKNNQS